MRVVRATVQPSCSVADEVRGRHAHVVEEHLVEVGLAGDLPQRPDGDAGRAQVDDEARDALVLGHGRVGAEDAEAEVAVVRAARPHLLAVEHELVAVALGARAERSEVGPGVGLAPQLAPDLLAAAHRLEVAGLLRVGAVGDDRRPDHGDADLNSVSGTS